MLLGLGPRSLIKYASSNGAALWKIPLTSGRRDTLLAMDDVGNVLVAESDSYDPSTFRTAKYAGNSGALLWESAPLGIFPPSDGGYYATALATGPNGTAAAILNFEDSHRLGTFVTIAYQDRLPPLSIQVVKEGARIRFHGSPSTSYRLNRADAIGGPWSLIATFTSAADGTAGYLDATPISGQAFYRVSSSSLGAQR